MSTCWSRHCIELPYQADSADLFARIADLPWAAFLDSNASACGGHPGSRYDILTADPDETLIVRGEAAEIRSAAGIRRSRADPFQLLREGLGSPVEPIEDIPFAGGALGYFAYDLGRRVERLPRWSRDRQGLPEMAVGFYDWAVVVDHARQRTRLVAHDHGDDARERLRQVERRLRRGEDRSDREPFRVTGPVRCNLGRSDYAAGFRAIRDYIHEGDCYQINYARQFSAPAMGSAWRAYRGLRAVNPAPYGAFLDLPFVKILSSSPEQFLEVRAGRVTTRPIKGTRPRGADEREDRERAEALRRSAKDRAENLMIVDLLRNDLGRVCRPGSIRVPHLYALESFASVHHLVSTVTGELEWGRDTVDLLRACFPGGSITGAPKVRAMEIIEELEPERRGVYCGAVGYLGRDGAMDTNVAIRTLTYADGLMRFGAGGGIVADSEEEAEFRETEDKAARLRRLLEAGGGGKCGEQAADERG